MSSNFDKVTEKTSHDALTRLTKDAILCFYNTAISRYNHYEAIIDGICDGLREICEATIPKYVQCQIEDSKLFHEITCNPPKWLQCYVKAVNHDADDYGADLIIPAVRDIVGYVSESDLCRCYVKEAMEWSVLNALEEICNQNPPDATSLNDQVKRQVAYTLGILSQSNSKITDSQHQKIRETLNMLFQCYSNVAQNYRLKTQKLIKLIREKQLRNEFVHYKEAIRAYQHNRDDINHLEGFLALEANKPLKQVLRNYKEIEILPIMFQSCRKFLQLSKAARFWPGDSVMVKPLANLNTNSEKHGEPYAAVFVREISLRESRIRRKSNNKLELVQTRNIYHKS
ncbi:unnamed protein product [Adineta steineri]|uniref:Uncharacterized protein n=1 Tax=Adineta steineri TaxID=433720 RepID=A0A819Q4D2_9BILA|nr:unnamed protein product [Adineta steineri]